MPVRYPDFFGETCPSQLDTLSYGVYHNGRHTVRSSTIAGSARRISEHARPMACARFIIFWEDVVMLPCRRWISVFTGLVMWLVALVTADAQFILRETFETDGDGTRYNFVGKGFEIHSGGPAVWGRDSDATRIGLATEAPKKRAGILWDSNSIAGDYTNDAFMVFDSLIGWATNNKANARVGFFPGPVGQGAIDIRDRLVAAGHTVTDIPDVVSLPAANQLDLLIHSNEARPRSAGGLRDIRRTNHCIQFRQS